jgi:trehalose 6-phosphate phosphatase
VSQSRSILDPQHRPLITSFAGRKLLVALDFDGVLSPIAPTPADARVEAPTLKLVTRVAQLYPSVVISGRHRDDLVPRLDGVPFARLIGNFGYQAATRSADPGARTMVHQWAAELASRLDAGPGVMIEDKGFSLAVHYRHARHREAARARIVELVSTLPHARWMQGTLAISVLPADGRNKGTALQDVRRALHCDCALYVGDDDTDEDAFASDGPERLIAVRVGRAAQSHAPYRLHHQTEINELLRVLIHLRTAGSGLRAPGAGH